MNQLHETTWGKPPADSPVGDTCDCCREELGNMAWSVHGQLLCDDCFVDRCIQEVEEMSLTKLGDLFGYGRVYCE